MARPMPIELRYHMARFTLEHLHAGMQPIAQNVDGKKVLFAPPALQYRVLQKAVVDGKPVTEWSEWADVLYVHEKAPESPQ